MNQDAIRDVEDLENRLSTPTEGVLETMARLEGDLIVLGVAGKMGPTLARMARRAADVVGGGRRVIGVARFTDAASEERLQAHGVETIRCDLLDEDGLSRLPDAPNVVYMAGRKFGTTGQEAVTWALNAYLPGPVCRRFRDSRIAAFSTGNVYGLVPVASPSRESDAPAPAGEYAMSCLGRERMFEHFSRTLSIPSALIRLNYATEMRYGVLVDIAQKVRDGLPVDLSVGSFNVIWQGDANANALQTFDHLATPPWLINVTGPEILNVRETAETFGRLFGRSATFTGAETEQALLSDSSQAFRLFGRPKISADQMIRWIADWLARGGPTLGKPTHFEASDGKF
ncbi:MAG: NAD(P)-dependent oxidoreductase [Paludisphaera borealis]|uniref:NAD-dependent epimerase/dehydratase family protein n=1 Tax=Paludisphaera borealis TaxID=1387353 RepID=UPI0028433D27|nr:NAD(P)-dependent oxidoreductase [Paludisphaera borealis]MDR3620156.1 NAD(P)-dependent oxidoreductase [Paludisphaera borealis]